MIKSLFSKYRKFIFYYWNIYLMYIKIIILPGKILLSYIIIVSIFYSAYFLFLEWFLSLCLLFFLLYAKHKLQSNRIKTKIEIKNILFIYVYIYLYIYIYLCINHTSDFILFLGYTILSIAPLAIGW